METRIHKSNTQELAHRLTMRWIAALVTIAAALCVVLLLVGQESRDIKTATERISDLNLLRSSSLQVILHEGAARGLTTDEVEVSHALERFDRVTSRIVEMPPSGGTGLDLQDFEARANAFLNSTKNPSLHSKDDQTHDELIESIDALEEHYRTELAASERNHLLWLLSAGGLFLLSAVGSGLFLIRPAIREFEEHVALQTSQATRQAVRLFDHSVALLVIMTRDLEIIRTSPSARELLGKSDESLSGECLLDSVAAVDREDVRNGLEPARNGKAVVDFECRVVTANDTEKYLTWRATSLAEDNLIYAAAMDVTIARQLRESLDRRNSELSRSNEALDEFAYVASHDLRAPLRDIENLSLWIQEDLGEALPQTSREHLRKLRQRVERMDTLLVDLLEYSRAGRLDTETQQVELRPLVEVAIELSHIPDGFIVETDLQTRVIEAPAARIKQVVMNLIGNAVNHHDRDDGRIKIETFDEGEYVVIRVSDDGPGIDEAYHDRIFELFRTTRPAADENRGAGVGLALIRKVVEAHNGTIHLESAPGHGATFTVHWPQKRSTDTESA